MSEPETIHQGVHNYSDEAAWVKPGDPLLLERLEWFKDQKLGIMMHWGLYSQLGIVESWALSDEDEEWSREGIDWGVDGEEFKRQYFDLNRTFNPIRFQPEQWADIAAEGGFKYLIFTTKHHDGFCMWDTQTTDYCITGPDSPFQSHKYADICKHLFDAFRDKGMAIAAYFSKADWHTPKYWAPGMERGSKTWRGPSYDPQLNPELWESFVQFTHEQITELLTKYGRIDVLWLDAGWVRDGGKVRQNIRLGEAVDLARKNQPWLLTADRTVGGPYENIVTPEQTIPSHAMEVPWESSITIGISYAYRYDDEYKSLRQLVHILLEVVSKGGNLALNVAPQPDGRLPEPAISRIRELGLWMGTYGDAIYGTRICAPYFSRGFAFTRKQQFVYCAYLYSNEDETVNEYIVIPYIESVIGIELLGVNERLDYEAVEGGLKVRLPAAERTDKAPIAHVFMLKV